MMTCRILLLFSQSVVLSLPPCSRGLRFDCIGFGAFDTLCELSVSVSSVVNKVTVNGCHCKVILWRHIWYDCNRTSASLNAAVNGCSIIAKLWVSGLKWFQIHSYALSVVSFFSAAGWLFGSALLRTGKHGHGAFRPKSFFACAFR